MNSYLDCFDYARSTSGLEFQTLVGNMTRFTSVQTAGATTLTVPTSGMGAITVQLNMFDRVSIFDGSSTEVVQVGSAGAGVGAASIPLLTGTTLAFTHAVGVSWCSDGAGGSLADQIINASTWIETQCNQPLLQTTWTNELLAMPTMRASIANDGVLHFRPRHWPINSLSALSIAVTPTLSTTYDTTQVFIDSDKQVCSMPNLLPLGAQNQTQSPYPIVPQLNRMQWAQLSLTYQAGYAYAALPSDLKEAAVLVVSDLLAKRQNPMGADQLQQGDVRIISVLRGDMTGESTLIKRARETLIKYSTESF